jgi:hypothetical protein
MREGISDETVRRYGVTTVLLVFSLIALAVGIGALGDRWRDRGNSVVVEGTVLTVRFTVPTRGTEHPGSPVATPPLAAVPSPAVPTDASRSPCG